MTFITNHHDMINDERMIVLFLDECHLQWGDVVHYGWGLQNERLIRRLSNPRQRQTYYGALNMHTGDMIVMDAKTANSDETIRFLDSIRTIYADTSVVILWDGASYHDSTILRDYLTKINHETDEQDRKIHCIQFAPYAPEQNPIETIWLKAKHMLRKHGWNATKFNEIKKLFVDTIHNQQFTYKNLNMYIES